jgi:hypothetical protein
MVARKIPANHELNAPQTTNLTLRAIQALFQLSYSPEGEVGRIVPGASQGEG